MSVYNLFLSSALIVSKYYMLGNCAELISYVALTDA